MKWFRLYHSLAHSIRVGRLSDRAFRSYILLLCAASERREGGSTGLSVEDASWQFRFDVTEPLSELLATSPPLAEIDADGLVLIPDWNDRQTDSDSTYERVKRYRERLRNGGIPIGHERAAALKARDGGACVFCASPDQLTIDHLIPLVQGGDNADDNLGTCCKSCNSVKRHRRPEEAGLGFVNVEAETRYQAAVTRIAEKVKRDRSRDSHAIEESRGEESREDQPHHQGKVATNGQDGGVLRLVGGHAKKPRDAPPPKKPPPTPKALRLSATWKLPQEWGEWALEKGKAYGWTIETVREIAETFRDYWCAKPKEATKLDWLATWRNWIRKELKSPHPQVGRAGTHLSAAGQHNQAALTAWLESDPGGNAHGTD